MPKARRFWIFILLPFLVIVAHSAGFLKPVERGVARVALPLEGAFFRVGIGIKNFFKNQFEIRESTSENALLREQIVHLESELGRMHELEIETQELRGLLNFQKRTETRLVAGNVVGERTVGSARTFLIDRGSDDGLQKDLPVVNRDGILVGKIFDVKEKSSLVLILLDGRSRVAATIQNRDGTTGIVEGGYGLSSSMKFIPQSEEIEIGDLVVTSGLEETVPRGLIIGTVESITKEVRDPFQEATIKPLVDFEKLITVAVILPAI